MKTIKLASGSTMLTLSREDTPDGPAVRKASIVFQQHMYEDGFYLVKHRYEAPTMMINLASGGCIKPVTR